MLSSGAEQMQNQTLQRNDLKNNISNRISIDQFLPMFDKSGNIIVSAFFVNSESAAIDLVSFLAKSPFVYNVEKSRAPTSNGNWLVFVEQEKRNFIKKFDMMLYEVSQLSGIQDWVFQWNRMNTDMRYTKNKLKKLLDSVAVNNKTTNNTKSTDTPDSDKKINKNTKTSRTRKNAKPKNTKSK